MLQVGKFFPPHPGGIETTTKDLFEVNNNNYVCDVLCFSSTAKTIVEQHSTGKIIRCGTLFKVASMPISLSYIFKFRKIHRQYDVLHVHHPNPLPFICLLFLSIKARLVIHWHSDILNKGLFYTFFAPIEKRILKKADSIAGTSPIYIQQSPPLQPFISKCTYIPSGFTEHSLPYSEQMVENIREKYTHKKIIFSLGRHVSYKGFQYLVEAAKYLPDDTVIIIGGTGALLNIHKKLAADMNVAGKVIFPGKIENSQLGSYYKACDIFCLPSTYKSEAFGLVMVEAMSFSKPIVAAKIYASGVSWVNQDGETGLNAENENPESLAEKLNILLQNETMRQQYGANAYTRFKQYFTVEILRDLFGKLYNSLVNGIRQS